MPKSLAEAVVDAVRERIAQEPEDEQRFAVSGPAFEEGEVVYVTVDLKEPFDVSRRYERYVRLGAIEADVRHRTGASISLVPGLAGAFEREAHRDAA